MIYLVVLCLDLKCETYQVVKAFLTEECCDKFILSKRYLHKKSIKIEDWEMFNAQNNDE